MQQKIGPPRHIAQVPIWEDDLGILDIHAQLNSLKIKWIQRLFGTKCSRMAQVKFMEGSL